VTWRRFSNHVGLLSCLAEQACGGSNEDGEAGRPEAWVDGWQDVLHEVGRIGQLACCVGSDRSPAGRVLDSGVPSDVCGHHGGSDEDSMSPGGTATA
jgi:hypothetical protein